MTTELADLGAADDLEAVRKVVEAIKDFGPADQERIIRWALEKLHHAVGPDGHRPTATVAPGADLKDVARGAKGQAERAAIALALERSRGVRKSAASALGISYKALLYKIRMYGLENPEGS